MSNENSVMRQEVIDCMVGYSLLRPYDFRAHMCAAAVNFYLRDREGLDLMMRVQFVNAAHIVVATSSQMDGLDSRLSHAHALMHRLIDNLIKKMEEQGIHVTRSESHSESDDNSMGDYDEDFAKWAQQLKENPEGD